MNNILTYAVHLDDHLSDTFVKVIRKERNNIAHFQPRPKSCVARE